MMMTVVSTHAKGNSLR